MSDPTDYPGHAEDLYVFGGGDRAALVSLCDCCAGGAPLLLTVTDAEGSTAAVPLAVAEAARLHQMFGAVLNSIRLDAEAGGYGDGL